MRQMKFLFIALCLMSAPAFAARLEDVQFLSSDPSADGVTLKLQVKHGPKGSYFFVNVVKSDPDALNKLALVIQELQKGQKLKLNLDIPSFSVSPPGSSYRSNFVKFSSSN